MRSRRSDLEAGQFIGEQVDFVDQDREALRANVSCFAFESQVHERDLMVCLATVQAFNFGHDVSNR